MRQAASKLLVARRMSSKDTEWVTLPLLSLVLLLLLPFLLLLLSLLLLLLVLNWGRGSAAGAADGDDAAAFAFACVADADAGTDVRGDDVYGTGAGGAGDVVYGFISFSSSGASRLEPCPLLLRLLRLRLLLPLLLRRSDDQTYFALYRPLIDSLHTAPYR